MEIDWNETLEHQIRKIVREELRSLMSSVQDTAKGKSGSSDETIEVITFGSVESVAETVLARLSCPHPAYRSYCGTARCTECWEPEPSPGEEEKRS